LIIAFFLYLLWFIFAGLGPEYFHGGIHLRRPLDWDFSTQMNRCAVLKKANIIQILEMTLHIDRIFIGYNKYQKAQATAALNDFYHVTFTASQSMSLSTLTSLRPFPKQGKAKAPTKASTQPRRTHSSDYLP